MASYRRGLATRPSSLYSPTPPQTLLGKGLSISSPFLNTIGSSSFSSGHNSPFGGYSSSYGSSGAYGGTSGFTSGYSSPGGYNSSNYSSFNSNKNFLSRSNSSGYRSPSNRSISVSPSVSRYPSNRSTRIHKSRRSKSASSSEGYASENEKDKVEPLSRVSSTSLPDDSEKASENGEIDYKKLYEESQCENERLRGKLKKTEDDLTRAKLMSEKVPYVPMRNSLSEAEKREKRAMERKLAEMEEELKQLQKLKADNERLKAENRALTRVVSKLTAAQNGFDKLQKQ